MITNAEGVLELDHAGGGCLSYKRLYHAAVERGLNLQEQLERCSSLLSKHHKITELKDEALSCLTRNKDLVETYQRRVTQKANGWKEKLDTSLVRERKLEQEHCKLQEECAAEKVACGELTAMCGRLMARLAIARAENVAKEDANTRKKAEIDKVKKKFSKYAQSLTAKYNTVKESLDFSEAERASLVEANVELEQQCKQFQERTSSLQRAMAELQEARALPPPPPTPSLPRPEPSSGCVQCRELSRQLGVALDALNNRGCAKYGDLLNSNFNMQQKLTALLQEHQSLADYIQEYKERSVEKVRILKENIQKADTEIAELDKLIEVVREAMHESMDLVIQSPHLLRALQEIGGTNKSH